MLTAAMRTRRCGGCEEDGGDLARELVPDPALSPLPAPAWP